MDEVHLEGFETITNMENSIKETETMIKCIYTCDFEAQTEEEVAKHIDIVHLEKDETEPTSVSNKACKNGIYCHFLKQNRYVGV